MTHTDFENFRAKFSGEADRLFKTKSAEYANRSDERFNNFKDIASRLALTPMEVAWILMSKHFSPIEDQLKSIRINPNQAPYKLESIRSRLMDVRIYVDLIAGMYEEYVCSNDTKSYSSSNTLESILKEK